MTGASGPVRACLRLALAAAVLSPGAAVSSQEADVSSQEAAVSSQEADVDSQDAAASSQEVAVASQDEVAAPGIESIPLELAVWFEQAALAPGARLAVLLAPATLSTAPGSGTAVLAEVPAGTVVVRYGERRDDFGRDWHEVGVPWGLERFEDELLAPFSPRIYRDWLGAAGERAERVAFLDLEGERSGTVVFDAAPAAASSRSGRGGTRADGWRLSWWTRIRAVGAGRLAEFEGMAAVPLRRVPWLVALEMLALRGGVEALPGWPAEPRLGQIHVPAPLPLLFRWTGDRWQLDDPPLFAGEVVSLLDNPELRVDRDAPEVAASPPLPCWTLVGAVDPSGAVGGILARAAEPPAPDVPADAWRADRLGRRDLSKVLQRVVPEGQQVPEVPDGLEADAEELRGGVQVVDRDRRAAVYLEQSLPSELVAALAGRTLVLEVVARSPEDGGAGTAGIFVDLDGDPVVRGITVSERPSPVRLEIALPADATRLTVRLLPTDPSLAVDGLGSAIFDRAVLRPADWPAELSRADLLLHRARLIGYRPLRAYTRAPLVASGRPLDAVLAAWRGAMAAALDEERRRSVISGEVVAGMSPEQVRLAWGEPSAVIEGPELPGLEARWDYADRSATFGDGRLVAWSLPGPEPPPETPSPCFPAAVPR